MRNLGTLIVGVLSVIAVLTITAIVMSVAPYIAGAIVILGLLWFYCGIEAPAKESSEVKSE